MSRRRSPLASSLLPIRQSARRLLGDRRGSVAAIMAVLLPALVGALGVGFEVSNWYRQARSMQNAADSAALAAALNGGSNYDIEAKAVAAQYGFINGANNVTVAVTNTAACPSGGNTCYSVAITSLVPLYVAPVVGYKGDVTINGSAQKSLSASAVTTVGAAPVQYCLLALGSSGTQGIRANGDASANMAG